MSDTTETENKGAPSWMVTFADLMALMMTFFVLLYSFSRIDEEKYRSIVNSMEQGFDGVQWIKRHLSDQSITGPEPGIIQPPAPIVKPKPQADETKDKGKPSPLERLHKDLSKEIATNTISVEQKGTEVIVRLPEKVSFPSGSDVLTERISSILYRIGHILETSEGDIMIAGHTDDRPITTRRFRSNWELSSARAIAVAEFLIQGIKLDRKRIIVVGHADTRPLVKNNSQKNRAINRRVEIRLIKTKPSE